MLDLKPLGNLQKMMCGEIWWTDFGEPFGSEPGFRRPALIIQSDVLNESDLNTTIVLPLTTNLSLAEFRGNILVTKEQSTLSKDSVIVGAQIIVVDKARLLEKAGQINDSILLEALYELFYILGKSKPQLFS